MKRFFSTLSALVVLTASTQITATQITATQTKTQPPACKGTSVLEAERAKHPKEYDAAMKQASKVQNGNAIFWKIERKGIKQPSYLFGTIHITDPRVNNLPDSTLGAIKNARVIALELKELGKPNAANNALMQNLTLTVLEPGGHLWTIMGKENSALVKKELQRRGIPAFLFGGMKPYVPAMMMGVPLCEMNRKKAGLKVLDERLAGMATKYKIPLVGLEKMREQLEAFSSMPIPAQKAFLIQTAKNGPRATDYLETMVQLYLNRKMNIMTGLMLLENKQGVADHFSEVLLKKRNHTMVKRGIPLLEKGGAFIAVGALHLPGNDGLVNLFRNKGFKLIPIN